MRNTRKSGQILRSKKRPRPTLRSGRASRTNSNTSHQIPGRVIEADSARAVSVPDPRSPQLIQPGAAAAVITVPSMGWLAEIVTSLSQLPALVRATVDTRSSNMTEALASKTCTPCRGGVPPLTREQAELFHAQAPDWQLAEEARRIERSFRFRNFREALTFVQEIGELAEAEGHHPNISFGWGNATVSLQTKKIKGLHQNNFIMATKIDRIFARTVTA